MQGVAAVGARKGTSARSVHAQAGNDGLRWRHFAGPQGRPPNGVGASNCVPIPLVFWSNIACQGWTCAADNSESRQRAAFLTRCTRLWGDARRRKGDGVYAGVSLGGPTPPSYSARGHAALAYHHVRFCRASRRGSPGWNQDSMTWKLNDSWSMAHWWMRGAPTGAPKRRWSR